MVWPADDRTGRKRTRRSKGLRAGIENGVDICVQSQRFLHHTLWVSEVAQPCPTLCNPVDCSLPGFSVHGILQARILEWVTISFSRGSSRPRDRTRISHIGGRRFNLWATRKAHIAKLLQSCPTLCDPIDGSPPRLPIPGILQARTLEWAVISSSNAWKWKVKVKSLSHVQPSATPWTAAHQAPLSMGVSRQEYWSGVPLPSLEAHISAHQKESTTKERNHQTDQTTWPSSESMPGFKPRPTQWLIKKTCRDFPVVQWLRPCTFQCRGPGFDFSVVRELNPTCHN